MRADQWTRSIASRQIGDCGHSPLVDHLLARLGEDFSEYAAVMASAFDHSDAKVIADKCAFLAEAASLTARRAQAYPQRPDDPADLWNTDKVSGLERRLARLLGIADFTRRNLGAVSYDTYAEVDSRPGRTCFTILLPISDRV